MKQPDPGKARSARERHSVPPGSCRLESVGLTLLPDEIQPFGAIRKCMLRRKALFLTHGGQAMTEIAQTNQEIRQHKADAAANFPLKAGELADFVANLRDQIMRVYDVEQKLLQSAMTGSVNTG